MKPSNKGNGMEQDGMLKRHCELLKLVTSLPKRMVSLDHNFNHSQFVLHELSRDKCFDLPRVAYFVDNPDFNCLKGVSGVCRQELGASCAIDWSKPEIFDQYMGKSHFNKQVRDVNIESPLRNKRSDGDLAGQLADSLDIKNFTYCAWPLKHDNRGLLVYEKTDLHDMFVNEHLADALYLLSFCPIH